MLYLRTYRIPPQGNGAQIGLIQGSHVWTQGQHVWQQRALAYRARSVPTLDNSVQTFVVEEMPRPAHSDVVFGCQCLQANGAGFSHVERTATLRPRQGHELVGRHPLAPVGRRTTHQHLRPHPSSPRHIDEVNGKEPKDPQKTGGVLDDPVNRVDLPPRHTTTRNLLCDLPDGQGGRRRILVTGREGVGERRRTLLQYL